MPKFKYNSMDRRRVPRSLGLTVGGAKPYILGVSRPDAFTFDCSIAIMPIITAGEDFFTKVTNVTPPENIDADPAHWFWQEGASLFNADSVVIQPTGETTVVVSAILPSTGWLIYDGRDDHLHAALGYILSPTVISFV